MILTTLYIPDKKPTIYFSIITSLLVILGIFTSPSGGEEWKVLFNRGLALFAIWSTAFVILLRKKSIDELFILNSQLEDMVTERTAELENTQADLIEANRMAVMGKLTGTVSHELRNPLSVINASLYLLKNSCKPDNHKGLEYLNRIEKNVTRCDYIIDELFNFTRNQSITLSNQHVDELVDSISNEYKMPEHIHFKCDLGLNNQYCYIDNIKLKRAITNALDNASQAILANDKNIHQAEILIKTYLSDKKIIIEIRDNGPGIPEKNMDKILEPLFSTKSFALGLGLSISRKIMEQHNGGIKINSNTDTGSSILLWLPDNSTST
ncbi:MAG: ATP-binding protein [Gammaproteobacteria bacterium]|nr:ATP-binding protein [Gammaproteobacteria bacterium]